MQKICDCNAPYVCKACGFIDNEILAEKQNRVIETEIGSTTVCKCGFDNFEEFPITLLNSYSIGEYYEPLAKENNSKGG